MVTAVTTATTQATTAAQNATSQPGGDSMLSDVARDALAGLGRLQDRFSESINTLESTTAQRVPANGEAAEIAASTRDVAQMMQVSAKVQSQIVQFAMATSMSSSLGNNLNTFLKGQ